MINKQSYQIQGMRQDNLVGTGFSSKFAHEIMNMRLNTIGDYTTASWTVEKGTKELTIEAGPNGTERYPWIDTQSWYIYTEHGGLIEREEGGKYSISDFKPIGQANINDNWVLFGIVNNRDVPIHEVELPSKYDVILSIYYKADNNNTEKLYGRILYWGQLNFNEEYPIETITFYENEKLQKVYWTDGLNQPRVINIADTRIRPNVNTQFDFIQEVSLNETVTINKQQLGIGIFPPCSVKYAITYYRKYGAETNIVYESPLYYPTIGDRACSPDEVSGDSFEIIVDNIDKEHNFDYVRLYSIIRTSDGATPIVRIVEDKTIPQNNDPVTFIDTNTKGEIIDPDIIQYLGGRDIVVGTLNQKNNTLFLGNLELKQTSLAGLNLQLDKEALVFTNEENKKLIPDGITDNQFYAYSNEMNPTTISIQELSPAVINIDKYYYGNSQEFKCFKTEECYRFGLQAQNINGVWSDVVYIRDINFEIKPTHYGSSKGYYKLGYAEFTINSDIVNTLYNNKYRKVRLVCCYPTINERKVLAQGIINPTISNNGEESDHTPDRMASWFFRTNAEEDFTKEVYSHQKYETASYIENTTTKTKPLFNNDNDSLYKIRTDVLTLNSPDIELNDSVRTFDITNMNINIVGKTYLSKFSNAIYLDADSPATNNIGVTNTGLSNKTLTGDTSSSVIDIHYRKDFAIWNDCNVYYWLNGNDLQQYSIFPFHRNSSLNNYVRDIKEWKVEDTPGDDNKNNIPITQHAKLNSKAMSYLSYCSTIEYLNTGALSTTNFAWFDSNEVVPTLLDSTVYYGNMNTLAPVFKLPMDKNDIENYSIKLINGHDSSQKLNTVGSYLIKKEYNNVNHGFEWDNNISDYKLKSSLLSSDPVPITYKSTPHLVFKASNFSRSIGDSSTVRGQYLRIGELVRSGASRNPKSYTDVYIPCGPAVKLEVNTSCTMYGLEGDSYLMRYDCLKTYPYTTEDVNQIIEIASIMCETRINLDGRYDRNRGLTDNTTVLPTNFNLINKSYTQTNNLFSYFTLDENDATLDKFGNQFTWTKSKVSGEDVDTWTNITLASTADANGTLGEITKIINLNDNLYLFQDHGIAKINFNENTAISTENGIPLELAKTGKFTGLDYLSTEIGCQNKWSISSTKNGVFFIDDSRQELLTLSEGFTSLSTVNGFDAFMIKQLPSMFAKWNPKDFNNFVTYYDKLSNDVYYINKNTCLSWNEQSKTFTSFYNYEHTPYMMNLGNHSLIWHNNVYAAREDDDYSKFFGTCKNYWMTLVCDGMTDKGSAFPADKVFNNIEYRADVYNIDGNNTNYATSVFNKQHVWNGYQDSHECNLDGIRKFNTWRVQLPRHYGTRDRIRNPFCYIKLKQDQSVNTQTDRMILHDLAVYFDMK